MGNPDSVLFMGDVLPGRSAPKPHGTMLCGIEPPLVLPQQRTDACALQNGLTPRTPEPGLGAGSASAGTKPRPPVPFFKFFLAYPHAQNNLNMNFPNPSREFFENMKGTYITIERGQGWPRQFLLSFLAFRCCLLSTDVSALGEPRSELMLLCLLDPLRSAVSALPLFLQTRVPNKSRYSSKPGMSKSAPNANISSKGKQAGSTS